MSKQIKHSKRYAFHALFRSDPLILQAELVRSSSRTRWLVNIGDESVTPNAARKIAAKLVELADFADEQTKKGNVR